MQLSFDWGEPSKLSEIRARLLIIFGPQRDGWRLDPVSQLVNAMVSYRTRDDVSLPVFDRLWHRFASWDLLIPTPHAKIEAMIRPVTYAAKKAVYLPRALGKIVAQTGALDLHFLANWREERSLRQLCGLPGVGPKIAATVLNFSMLRKRTLSVDTHLLRVGERLGLLRKRANFKSGYAAFMRLVPDEWDADDLYEFHWLMKYLGQRICTYMTPACSRCPLRDLCPIGSHESTLLGWELAQCSGTRRGSPGGRRGLRSNHPRG